MHYNVGRSTGRLDPLLPPPWLHSVGGADYAQSGEEFFRYFVDIAGLMPQERVLDVGCGTGRMARPLTRYLKGGSYDGIDIVAPSIKWCQQAYADSYPNFRFHFTDIYNKVYNPHGRYQASEYRFPFESSSFDFVFLTSVFTHLLPQDMENYLSEVARVLRPGGRCLITYFLLTPDSLNFIGEKAGAFTFRYQFEGCRVEQEDVPEVAIAYDESRIRSLYEKYQLHISRPVCYGSWCGRTDGLSYQDIVVASKLG
ncbi:MAG TPA: class I SAM-dependent methyltransferase [Pyrinomonadaceae bacterium]|nr:class I SAM-dependent methyltransferase [Pyrinomonadaceae bacterium]